MRKRKTLRMEITVVVSLILLLVLGIQFLVAFFFTEAYYTNRKVILIKNCYQEIVEKAKKYPKKNIARIITPYVNESGLHIIVANKTGDYIFNSKRYRSRRRTKLHSGFDFEKNKEKFSKDAKVVKVIRKNGTKQKLSLYGIIEKGEKNFYIMISVRLERIKKERMEANWVLIYMSIIAFSIGGIFVYYSAKRISKPIEQIDEVARKLANMDFSVRAVQKNTEDEIGQLAENINIMADALEENIYELQKKNKILEKDIEYHAQIDEMRKDFVANVSHELKTPLSILTGYTEILKTGMDGIDKEYYYDVILDETKRMNELVGNLLELSSIEHGLTNLKTDIVNLTDLALEIVEKNKILVEKHGIILLLVSEEEYYVVGNKFYLSQAITNYLNNAIYHTKKKGKIRVSIIRKKGNICLTVFNEGVPIKEEILEKIWDSFYRGNKARTRDSNNHIGLGLYIVRTIINAHHGTYGVINHENGVEFFLSLKEIE